MKKLILTILLTILFSACATRVIEVPIHTTNTEIEFYDRLVRDSVFVHDSVFVKHKNDTIWMERYKTLYKEKIVRDSVYLRDSIRVEVPIIVEVEKDINIFKKLRYALYSILVLIGLFALYRILIIFKK